MVSKQEVFELIKRYGSGKQADADRLYRAIAIAHNHDRVDAALALGNELLKGSGVEPVTDERAWVDHYYQNIIALYVNQGDTYDSTLLYDTEHGDFQVTSWGDFFEGWEQEYEEEHGRGDEDEDDEGEVENPMRFGKLGRRLRPGTRVRVSHGSGVSSNKTGIVVDPGSVPRDGRGIPKLAGEYKPWDGKRAREESFVRLDSGEVISMFNDRLILENPAGGGGGVSYPPRVGNPRPASLRPHVRRSYQFMKGHAGGVVGESSMGALKLARAESYARDRLDFEWGPEQDPDLSWMDDEERKQDHEVESVLARDRETGEVVAALGNIVDADSAYRRLVEAELALEAMGERGHTGQSRRGRRNPGNPGNPGPVHKGTRYNVQLLDTFETKYDRYGSSRTKQNVIIEDTKTGQRYQYLGRGQDLGNFHPIWITVPGKGSISVESLLYKTEDIFPAKGHRLVKPNTSDWMAGGKRAKIPTILVYKNQTKGGRWTFSLLLPGGPYLHYAGHKEFDTAKEAEDFAVANIGKPDYGGDYQTVQHWDKAKVKVYKSGTRGPREAGIFGGWY